MEGSRARKSRRRLCRQLVCWHAWKPEMYSASHVEVATNFRGLDCQAMGPCRQSATRPDVERRV